MAADRADIARLNDLAGVQRLREDAAAAALAMAQECERQAEEQAAEARREAAVLDGEFRAFLAAGRFEPGQYQLFGALLAEQAHLVAQAQAALDLARQQVAQGQQAHALARLQTRQVETKLRQSQGRYRRKVEDRAAREHLDLHLTLKGAVRA